VDLSKESATTQMRLNQRPRSHEMLPFGKLFEALVFFDRSLKMNVHTQTFRVVEGLLQCCVYEIKNLKNMTGATVCWRMLHQAAVEAHVCIHLYMWLLWREILSANGIDQEAAWVEQTKRIEMLPQEQKDACLCIVLLHYLLMGFGFGKTLQLRPWGYTNELYIQKTFAFKNSEACMNWFYIFGELCRSKVENFERMLMPGYKRRAMAEPEPDEQQRPPKRQYQETEEAEKATKKGC